MKTVFETDPRKPTLCALCGRPLTDPVSVLRGLGEKCLKRLIEMAREKK